MNLPRTSDRWTLVTFTSSEAVVGEVAALQTRVSAVRCAVVVPAALAAPPGVLVVVDQDGALAAELGAGEGASFILDARGTVTHGWGEVPEVEALQVFAARPARPSGAPPWLFPVLAAVVVVAGAGAWAWSRAPEGGLVAAPAPVAPPAAEASVAAPSAPEAAVAPAADGEAAAAPEAPEAGAAQPDKKGGRRRPNEFGQWTVAPRDQAASVARLDGEVLTLQAVAGDTITACTAPRPLSGPLTVGVDWKLEGVGAKGARVLARQNDASGKAIKDPAARTALARGGGSLDWQTISATVQPLATASTVTVCAELLPGAGTLSVRNPK